MNDKTIQPGPIPGENTKTPRGYISEEARGGYLAKMWVFSITCLLAQFIIPMVITFMTMHTMFDQLSKLNFMDPSRAAYWEGALWLLETRPAREDGLPSRAKIARWVPGAEEPPSEAGIPPMYEPALVAAGDYLWVVGADTVARISRSGTESFRPLASLGPVSRPFAYAGRPAMVEAGTENFALRVFDGQDWAIEDIKLGPVGTDDIAMELMTVVEGPEGPGVVVAYDDAIYFQPDLSRLGHAPVTDWEEVADLELYWATGLTALGPTVITATELQDDSEGIHVKVRSGGTWEKLLDIDRGLVGRMSLHSAEKDGEFFVLAEGLPGSITVWTVRGSKVLSKTKITEGGPTPGQMNGLSIFSNAVGWIATVILALVLSALMIRAKVRTHQAHGRLAEYATMTRRAVASLVDLLILSAPLVALWFLWVGDAPLDVEEHGTSGMMRFMGFFGIASAWFLICMFLFSLLEGKTGQTPGKKIAGIRVLNVNLEPCGVGRAIIRNLLKAFADSLFNFILGMVMVAISPRWQRVGDLAAKTIVVRTTRSTGADSY